jgi:hypothetical protein
MVETPLSTTDPSDSNVGYGGLNPESQPESTNEPVLSWTASEFIAHHKTTNWYVSLAGAAILGAFVVWLLTKDKISAAVVLFGALFFGIYAGRQPRQLPYNIYAHGLSIGNKYHAYDEFRSFSVVPEGAFSSIVFTPLKRFGQLLTIYYAPEDEDKIIDILEDRLPYEEHKHDMVDNLMRRIRF